MSFVSIFISTIWLIGVVIKASMKMCDHYDIGNDDSLSINDDNTYCSNNNDNVSDNNSGNDNNDNDDRSNELKQSWTSSDRRSLYRRRHGISNHWNLYCLFTGFLNLTERKLQSSL